jgi:hypothetical protein
MGCSAPQTLTVNASGGAAVLSAAIGARFVRLQPTVDTFFLFTIAGDVTAGTGHFIAAGQCYDLPVDAGQTKVSVLGAGASAGTCYLSELGNI